ncbi:hypothetical protein BABINDRAFT_119608 [Babjeviella inositovora NRRL Y-12698]|uniref:Uncharacterized protein n=1 Tax=Babjeviella inositovora NRRL Y-12698 TaxID=984486 RepID=A0A1E3QVS7_9ASCO|nr:uncharacterized protein BABINDRAFT_119608 [Babjeviella inositovora NRRL Y-12698]ODQ81067.1 hypothetical protein BABINDRAFT_119608 [Babjeviella inositovora NRRL Y-12698]
MFIDRVLRLNRMILEPFDLETVLVHLRVPIIQHLISAISGSIQICWVFLVTNINSTSMC